MGMAMDTVTLATRGVSDSYRISPSVRVRTSIPTLSLSPNEVLSGVVRTSCGLAFCRALIEFVVSVIPRHRLQGQRSSLAAVGGRRGFADNDMGVGVEMLGWCAFVVHLSSFADLPLLVASLQLGQQLCNYFLRGRRHDI